MSKQLDLTQPVLLEPLHIAKPWGQEIWYTGMEERGESRVELGESILPLSEYLALDPARTCHNQQVLLLKILDPSIQPVIGDLYFEVHREKREVYIVTAVHSDAWPDGIGAIRFGMNQRKRQAYASDAAFRQAYLGAVRGYEAIRRDIDEQGGQRGDEEAQARAEMETYTEIQSLKVGDVVSVPTWTPHALQHGVRVIEFQTQTYERLIVSFAQAVLTQGHWDTAEAVEAMHLDPPAPPVFEQVSPGIERIARFEDFNVWRISGDCRFKLPDHLPYAICMSISGATQIGALRLKPEQACFLPRAGIAATEIDNTDTLLIAAPAL